MIEITNDQAKEMLESFQKVANQPRMNNDGKIWYRCLICGGTKTGKEPLKHSRLCKVIEHIKFLEKALENV